MTDLYADALEQDADDDADVVDSWMLYLRAPALTLDASEVLQSLVQTTRFRGCTIASQSPTCSRQHRDTNVVRNPAPLFDPDILIPDPAIPASSASFLSHCSAASASATSCFGASRAHEYFITGGTKVRRYKDEIDQEIRPSTYLLT